MYLIQYGDSVGNSLRTLVMSPWSKCTFAVSIDMWAVKLCFNKILQLLTGDADYHRLTYIMAVRWLLSWMSLNFGLKIISH